MAALRILIVDDNSLVRSGIRILLETHQNWRVCGEAANGIEAIAQAVALKPDLILLDISMPELDGLKALPLMRRRVPDAAIIILTLHESLSLARIAAHWGIGGYVTKSVVATELVPLIESLEEHAHAPHHMESHGG